MYGLVWSFQNVSAFSPQSLRVACVRRKCDKMICVKQGGLLVPWEGSDDDNLG